MTGLAVADIPGIGGTYVLGLFSDKAQRIAIGAKGPLRFAPGCYWYVGSALGPGGLRARLRRHIHGSGRRHWHIDYLRARLRLRSVWFATGSARYEHCWSQLLPDLPGVTAAQAGFGASDCSCETHLYFSPQAIPITALLNALSELGLPAALRELSPKDFVTRPALRAGVSDESAASR